MNIREAAHNASYIFQDTKQGKGGNVVFNDVLDTLLMILKVKWCLVYFIDCTNNRAHPGCNEDRNYSF